MDAVNINMPVLGKALLKRLESKEITMAEFDKECAYWMLDHLDAHAYTLYPSMPADLMDLYRRKKLDPAAQPRDTFWQQSHIKDYMMKESKARSSNNANKYWLSFMKKHIPEGDVTNHKRIDGVLCGYPKLEI